MEIYYKIYRFLIKNFIIVPIVFYGIGQFFGYTDAFWGMIALKTCEHVESCAEVIKPAEGMMANDNLPEDVNALLKQQLEKIQQQQSINH